MSELCRGSRVRRSQSCSQPSEKETAEMEWALGGPLFIVGRKHSGKGTQNRSNGNGGTIYKLAVIALDAGHVGREKLSFPKFQIKVASRSMTLSVSGKNRCRLLRMPDPTATLDFTDMRIHTVNATCSLKFAANENDTDGFCSL
uniref:Uncharacterized protein n=1 Tax=Nelumbo nucifera TaxID=4432 RepID=A0A822XNG2_NELNU|nr:TPA_asm: hypothetical protein HUJ06_023270 [Nelumbo nucifera]